MLSVTILKTLFSYDPKTGIITGPSGPCLTKSKDRIQINFTFEGKRYHFYAARLAWILHTGQYPKGEVHHIDENTLNDKFSNLVDMASSTHHKLHGKESYEKRLKGLELSKLKRNCLGSAHQLKSGKWVATYKQKYLGSFDSKLECRKACRAEFLQKNNMTEEELSALLSAF